MKAKMLLSLLGAIVAGIALVVYVCSLGDGATTATAGVATSQAELPPRAVIDETIYDFGIMDVGQTGEHTFRLRNEGAGPLQVSSGGTSCKCTMLDAPDGLIPPGEERNIRVEWHAPDPVNHFRHGAILNTNDPEHSQIKLTVEGRVRTFCGVWPPIVGFSDVLPTERRTQSVIVYSQTWDNFRIADLVSSDPHVKCRVLPVNPEELAKFEARSGYQVELTLEPGLPVGSNHTSIQVLLDVPDDPTIKQDFSREINVVHEVVGSFTIYGGNVDGNAVRLGAIARQRGLKETVSLYVRGEHRDVEFKEIHADPDFLKITIHRDEKVKGKTARYLMDIEVPPGSPVVDRMSQNLGMVELLTDHPDSPRVHFKVQFAIFE